MRAIGCAVLGAVNADASKGNVTLTGSSLTAGRTDGVYNGAGTAIIAATGNVNINEAREEHDSYQAIESKRGNFVSGSTTDPRPISASAAPCPATEFRSSFARIGRSRVATPSPPTK